MKKTLAAGLFAATFLAGVSTAHALEIPASTSTADWCAQVLAQAGTPRDIQPAPEGQAPTTGGTLTSDPHNTQPPSSGSVGTPSSTGGSSSTGPSTGANPGGSSSSNGTASGSDDRSNSPSRGGGGGSTPYLTNPNPSRARVFREDQVTIYRGVYTPGYSSQGDLAQVKPYRAPTNGIIKTLGGQRIKVRSQSTNLNGMHASIVNIIDELHLTAYALGFPAPVITSSNDGTHSPGTLHGTGKAIDVRCNDRSSRDCIRWTMTLKQALGRGYDVLFEDWGGPNNHIHIEYDGTP